MRCSAKVFVSFSMHVLEYDVLHMEEGFVLWMMAYDVPEFEGCGLLPFGQILVDCDRSILQHTFPETIDRRREINEIDNAVQLFCELIRG